MEYDIPYPTYIPYIGPNNAPLGVKCQGRVVTCFRASEADWSTALAPGLDRPGVNAVPRTGASEATERVRSYDAPDWSIRGGLEHGPSPRTGSSGGEPGATYWSIRGKGTPRTETSGGKRQADKGIWNPDWNIRGRSAPGLEHPGGGGPGLERPERSGPGLERLGQQKEKETATERNGEENMNTSKEQMRKDTKNTRREAGGEREEGEAAKHMEPG